ncbi:MULTISPECIES: tetratricopeptide repeat protein [unclassified Moorena]|uniref:tetratricopeptide repeat protein n=1 Tax=unclassified Moorena TaxID=2683338 RepID=UPI0025FE9128|nr:MULTISPECIES: tetratricopeptide repeat protein [unclassified Moorena]
MSLDSELLQVMAQVAEQLTTEGKQNSAEVLLGLRSELLDMLGISETPTSANPSSQDYLEFLTEVLLATDNSDSDPKVIYPLLAANLDKLDDKLIDILETWASPKLSEAEAEYIARVIWEFSHLIQQFPLGNKANNIEIAIAGYKQVLKVFTRESKRESWAAIQTNLGEAYRNRIRGDKAENLELAIAHYQRALSVYTKSDFPIYWAMTQTNLGEAYRNRIRHHRAENLELAIARYQLALSVYTQSDFPYHWAQTQTNLGEVYRNRIRGDRAYNLELAIEAFQQASSVRTKQDLPMAWAMTQKNSQNNLGLPIVTESVVISKTI